MAGSRAQRSEAFQTMTAARRWQQGSVLSQGIFMRVTFCPVCVITLLRSLAMPVCRAVMSRIAHGSWSGSQTTRSALVGSVSSARPISTAKIRFWCFDQIFSSTVSRKSLDATWACLPGQKSLTGVIVHRKHRRGGGNADGCRGLAPRARSGTV